MKMLRMMTACALTACLAAASWAQDGEKAPRMNDAEKGCVECHSEVSPNTHSDWMSSAHYQEGVTCLDCHRVKPDSEMAIQHEDVFDMSGYDTSLLDDRIHISVLVPPSTCAKCHDAEHQQFTEGGHYRSYHQIIPKDNLHALTQVHEGQNHPELAGAPNETGCMQCHGTEIKLDEDGRPTAETWPNAGMGNVYPDGSTGNCTACHSRHRFSVAEARQPFACAECHLGPDHPNIEIFEASKHGHVFNTRNDDEWNWDADGEDWEAGKDFRGPVCVTCHMSGVGDLETTHNVSERLHWVLWSKRSKLRDSDDPMSPILGDAEAGRAKMKQVCAECHSSAHTDNFFQQGDKAVKLYNKAYYDPAVKMRDELAEKGLLKENPWIDEFQITFYHLWHHQGRRARMGAMHGAADYAHWHGFFELMQDIYELKEIYNRRIETGEIE